MLRGSWCCITPCLNYQKWPWWYEEVVGGSYRLQREGEHPSSTVKNDQEISVSPDGTAPDPRGDRAVPDRGRSLQADVDFRPGPAAADHRQPDSDRILAWVGPVHDSRVVAIQLGHGPSAFGNPSYRALVHNAILWAAGRIQ